MSASSIHKLPPELLTKIAKDVEGDPALLSLRLASQTLKSVVTPAAFRVVIVKDSVESANSVSFLQGCDESVTAAVHEIIFQGDAQPDAPQQWSRESSGGAGREALVTTFSGLAKFPNLEHLRFEFHNDYQEEDSHEVPTNPTHFLRLQWALFDALASNPLPTLVSLTLNNLIGVPNEIYARENFHNIFRPLKMLTISAISDLDYEGSYFQEPLVEFWEESIAHMVRSSVSLTSLTLRSDQTVGAYPPLSFKNTFLPHLSELVLHRFALDPMIPDSDVVAFIVRHKATLTRLELHRCSIDGGEDMAYPRPWHAVLALFETELGSLRTFVLQHDHPDGGEDDDDDESPRDPRFAYTRLDPGWGYMSTSEKMDEDLPALESLLAVVESRNHQS
ncbi:hypothetical protein B0H11DRAFT_2246991 [Mycena galericulata]|nr:hypothetical protein B0H11DRAFT_2246991 [Mycena galericulata]